MRDVRDPRLNGPVDSWYVCKPADLCNWLDFKLTEIANMLKGKYRFKPTILLDKAPQVSIKSEYLLGVSIDGSRFMHYRLTTDDEGYIQQLLAKQVAHNVLKQVGYHIARQSLEAFNDGELNSYLTAINTGAPRH